MQPVIWYFADPMCSWCWGFSPVIDAIRSRYRQEARVALVLGGLRPGTTESISTQLREEILHHWHQVHEMTGQTFRFDGALPDGFIYDTEPASRAVVAASVIEADATFPMFKAVQAAFYRDQKAVTRPQVLAGLAADQGLIPRRFMEAFESANVKEKTRAHFQLARHKAVRGFPTLLLQNAAGYRLLTNGYRPFKALHPVIDTWLSGE